MGQLAAAVGALGPGIALTAPFWLCVLGIAGTGVLNLAVSFALAFRVALRSRGIQLADRARVRRAISRGSSPTSLARLPRSTRCTPRVRRP